MDKFFNWLQKDNDFNNFFAKSIVTLESDLTQILDLPEGNPNMASHILEEVAFVLPDNTYVSGQATPTYPTTPTVPTLTTPTTSNERELDSSRGPLGNEVFLLDSWSDDLSVSSGISPSTSDSSISMDSLPCPPTPPTSPNLNDEKITRLLPILLWMAPPVQHQIRYVNIPTPSLDNLSIWTYIRGHAVWQDYEEYETTIEEPEQMKMKSSSLPTPNNKSFMQDKLTSGHLTLITGPMFSGKTTELRSKLTTMADLTDQWQVLYINSKLDDREDVAGADRVVTTHQSGFKGLSPKITGLKVSLLQDVDSVIDQYDVIGVDEGQFFSDIKRVIDWVDRLNKIVLVAFLDGNTKREPFGQTYELYPHADVCQKMTAWCASCLQCTPPMLIAAPFTIRLSDNSAEVVIGGKDMYKPVCRYHYVQGQGQGS